MNYTQIQPEVKATYNGTNVEIVAMVEKSRTKVSVKETDRGKGWNEEAQKYTGYHRSGITGGAWERGENHCYGVEFEVHRKNLIQNS